MPAALGFRDSLASAENELGGATELKTSFVESGLLRRNAIIGISFVRNM
jgi:hypothetical protein